LIVDDEKLFLRSLSECLKTSGGNLHVCTAENGAEALRVLASEHVDVVVTDLKMPVMDGFQLLSHLREIHPYTPVIVMSASINPETERRLCALGVSHCIEKPLDVEDLVNRISMEEGNLNHLLA
jgi:CheY-like chemotaxis protein